MITIPLRILLVENAQADIEIINDHLHRIVVSPVLKVVNTLEDCARELVDFVPDVVISEYNFPSCTGLEIFELTQGTDSSLPFIFLTGAIDDEELAANTILSGATGFILKKNMDILEEKLKPLLKKIVFNMGVREEIRGSIRKNKIVVNQIYNYLDSIHFENEEQRKSIKKIRKNLDHLNSEYDQ